MDSLEVFSINLWQILISLCNLVILFLIVKHFLFKPVKKMLQARQDDVDKVYAAAELARADAEQDRDAWAEQMKGAQSKADGIIADASEKAARRSEAIVAQAQGKAESILTQAHTEAELEKKKAQAEIRQEIADVSAVLTEKMLGKKIDEDGHRELIRSFIDEMGENDDTNQ